MSFDPLYDEKMPVDIDALVIGGGFPEAHARSLSANESLRRDIAQLLGAGAPAVAECARLLYLSRSLDDLPMCGVLDIDTAMSSRLTLGYRDAEAVTDSPLASPGLRVHGHEFHQTTVRSNADSANAWRWTSRDATTTERLCAWQRARILPPHSLARSPWGE